MSVRFLPIVKCGRIRLFRLNRISIPARLVWLQLPRRLPRLRRACRAAGFPAASVELPRCWGGVRPDWC
ncbi:hypothetical protein NDU88_003938 [Pleurodeles waltl]|uniref:Uncharacterized protein n=1 Tax=Pleurodeles waltl TaxID=8319 RepID=A0AAV7W8Y1_PLEWA|nr:hypothetical protein NDU88_003938 [Pleurodeles waltl]